MEARTGMKERTKKYLLILVVLLVGTAAQSQTYRFHAPSDSLRLDSVFRQLPQAQLLDIAKTFLGTPYQADLLNNSGPETLILTAAHTDCQLFVEMILSLYELQSKYPQQVTMDHYAELLQGIRYRGGQCHGYVDRLHYLSDWIYENVQAKHVQDLTQAIGGQACHYTVNFMTQHPDSYLPLQNAKNWKALLQVEKNINQRKSYYIPKHRVSSLEHKIKDGDLIAITTNIAGMDMAHVGIACWVNGSLHLLHASSDHHRVMITKKTLSAYLNSNKRQTGIVVLRANP